MSPWTRPARPEDAPAMARLHVDAWREAYEGLLPEEVIASRTLEDRLETWTRAIADEAGPGLRIAVGGIDAEGRAILGIACAGRPHLPAAARASDPDPALGEELRTLYLLRSAYGTGLADALLDVVLPPGPAFCWALETNARALAYYRKRGFLPEAPPVTRGGVPPFELRLVRRG